MVVPVAPVVALAERKLLSGGQAVDGATCDASGGEGVAGIEKASALETGLDGAPIVGETKWMQVDSPAKDVLDFDPDWKPVLSRHKAKGGQKVQDFVKLVGIDGEVKVMMVPCLTSEQGVDRPAACDAGSHAFGGYLAKQAGDIAGVHGSTVATEPHAAHRHRGVDCLNTEREMGRPVACGVLAMSFANCRVDQRDRTTEEGPKCRETTTVRSSRRNTPPTVRLHGVEFRLEPST